MRTLPYKQVIVLAVGLALGNLAQAGELPNGRYIAVAVHSGKCVDVAGAGTGDSVNIQQATCNGNTAQVFDINDMGNGWYKLVNINSNKVMDVAGASTADGANIQQYSDNGTDAQRFAIRRFSGNEYVIVSKVSNKCVDVAEHGTQDGANIQQWSCAQSNNQRFRFIPLVNAGNAVPVGRYTLKAVHSELCLDVAGASKDAGANVQQWTCNSTAAQSFDLITKAGYYQLLNINSGKPVEVSGGATVNGANVQQGNVLNTDYQRFFLIDKGNGQYEVHSKHANKCLDVDKRSMVDGGNVIQWSCGNSQPNQKWALVADGSNGGPKPGWELVWADEFNGPNIDPSKWNFEVNGGGGGNNELQYYTDRNQNAFIQDGILVIQALRERYCSTDGCRDYTSARLNSDHKGDWLYGRFEARAKLPRGQGIWPAIWMLPTDWAYGGWPMSGEIDIMEAVNTDTAGGNNVYGSLHYGPAWPNNQHQTKGISPSSSVSRNFHTYAMEWDPREIRIYVNDTLYAKYTSWWTPNGAFPAPFDKRFHWVLNLAVGGNWPGSPDSNTVFPQRLELDWVRVYRKR
ncbi:RICIN domain-containing protein [Chitinivorax sp. B]|uniref:RICIN domain-containing protein n=1 Tax=Chitinivorax sp. B TaxID=2502235 RepID=UPI0010F82D51|nr:RICIN domain-containing protein [Chitinivorax sp. B]